MAALKIRLGLIPFIARLLLCSEFLIAVNGKIFGWSSQAQYMQSKGMSFVAPLLGAALFIELVGSLCIIAGYRARTAAAVMFAYLGIVTLRLHAFWRPGSSPMNATEFFKNLGMMGGLLLVAAHGPGAWAVTRDDHPAA
jgi:putative oxidoreductase